MEIKELKRLVEDCGSYIIEMRRDFHMYPEESWKEFRTTRRIKEELDQMGIQAELLGEVGVLATINGGEEGKTVCLRADIDALSIQEKTGLPYSSKNEGIMHACGHDAHTAVLLGAAKVLNSVRSSLKGTIKLLFQPAEEGEEVGAPKMIEKGVLKGVDAVFGLHYMNNIKPGQIALGAGPRLASCDDFRIDVKGKGGHGSAPHEGVDAVVVSAAIVMNIQTILSREINPIEPAVISIGTIKSGDRFNIISSEAVMTGTCRCFNPDLREELPAKIRRVVENTAKTFRAEASLEYRKNIPPLVNDKYCFGIAVEAAALAVGEENIVEMPMVMGSDDFAEYSLKVPGLYAVIGTGGNGNEYKYPVHHEKYQINEDDLETGALFMVNCAIVYLRNG